MSNKKRYDFIADMKTVSLIGVVLYHCTLFYANNPFFPESADFSTSWAVYICGIFDAMLVPSFVLCSGFLFANSLEKHKRTIGENLLAKAKSLLIPYYIYGAVWLVPLYTLFDLACFAHPAGTDLLTGYKDMLLGVFSEHLWFLWMLFWVSVIFVLMTPLIKKKFLPVVFAVSVVAAVVVKLFLSDFPYFKLSQIPPFIFCFFAGICLFMFIEKLEKLKRSVDIIISVLLLASFLAVIRFYTSHFIIGWIIRLLASVSFFFFFLGIERFGIFKKLRNTSLWSYTEANGLKIYLLNCPFMYIYFRILNPIFGRHALLCVLTNFVMCMVSLWLAVYIQKPIKKLFMKRGEADGQPQTE